MINRSFRSVTFENKVRTIINEHLSDENFGVSELAKELSISRATLHRKVKEAADKSVSSFIREIRLKQAYAMLQNGSVTVSEVAYKVGFSSATYFNKCFHDFYGIPPGDILKGKHATADVLESVAETEEKQSSRKKKQSYIRLSIILVIVIIATSVVIWMNSNLSIKKRENVIAVLPFENISNTTDSLGLAEGMRGSIIHLLTQINGIRIVSVTSTEKYQNSGISASTISKELGTQYVLSGRVQNNNEMVQITISLEDGISNDVVLTEQYDQQFTDIFSVQSSIAKTIADTLQLVLTPKEIESIEEEPTKYTDAYKLYVKGRFYWNKRTEEGIRESIKLFNEATELDPDYALAFAGLADAHFIASGYGYTERGKGSKLAREYAEKALTINNNLAEAHTTLGFTLGYDEWKWKLAEESLIQAIELNPQYAFAHHAYALWLDVTGDRRQAHKEIDLALLYEPLSPIFHYTKLSLYYNEGNFNMSLNQCKELDLLSPDFPSIHFWCFKNYYRLKDEENALASLQIMLESRKATSNYSSQAPTILEESGLDGLINWMIDISTDIKQEDENLYKELYWIRYMTELYAIAGKNEKALDLLEEYLSSNSEGDRLVRLLNNRDYMPLRNDQRYKEVVKELNLDKF